MIDLEREIITVKEALDSDFISREELKAALDILYQEVASGQTQGLLSILEQKGCLTSLQRTTLYQQAKVTQRIDVKNRHNVEIFFGLRKGKSEVSKTGDGHLVITCNSCHARFKIKKLPQKVTKFKCGKCQKYFTVTAPQSYPVAPSGTSTDGKKTKVLSVDIEARFSENAMFIGTKFDTPMPEIPQDYDDGYVTKR